MYKVLTLFLIKMVFMNILLLSNVKADCIATTSKQVNLNKEHEIIARLEEDSQILKGYAQIENTFDNKTQKEVLKVVITWTMLLNKNSKVPVDNLTSTTNLNKPVLPSGTKLLVKGNLPIPQFSLDKKKDEERKKLPISSNTTGSTTTNITSPTQNPVSTTPSNNNLFQPKIITTYEGCNHTYNPKTEIITAYQQTYYYDKNNKKVQIQACTPIREFPAQKRPCDNIHDFKEHFTYIRHQPFFTIYDPNTKAEEVFAAGGCIPTDRYPHELDYNVCEALAVGNKYIKRGKWFYQPPNGEKTYISNCILDPENKEKQLSIKFEGCPVTHDIDHNQSIHLGKYYYIKSDNTIEYLSDCIVTNQSQFKHQLEWNEQWEHNNDHWYSQRIFTRFIYIDSEKRKVIINKEELDPLKIPQKAVQVGWNHYDDRNPGSPKGSSKTIMKRFVEFNGISYYTNLTYEDKEHRHKYIRTDWNGKKEHCGGWIRPGVRRWYEDTIRRPDNTEYRTNEYDKGCKR